MCSIFAFIARNTADRPSIGALRDIVSANIRRGPHAFGFAWIDGRGRLRSYRQCGRLTDQLATLSMLADARMLIGHLRYATHGEPRDNINNHPHPADGGWLVHNGVVGNYRDLIDRDGVHLSSECDSEAIGQLIETSAADTIAARCASAVRRTTGPLAIFGLWHRPATLIVARRGNPLHWATTAEGTYLGSLADGLPGKVTGCRDNLLTRLSMRGGKVVASHTELPEPRERPSDLFDRHAGGVYRGG